jgi:drug/metabolite transporter (DMT)-like permease
MLAILVAASLYGVLNAVVKLAYQAGLSFEQVTYSQYIYGALGLLLVVLVTRSFRKLTAKAAIRLCLIGVLGLGGTSLFLYASLNRIPASMALVLLFQFTWISLVIEKWFLKKDITFKQVAAAVIILLGTLCVLHLQSLNLSGKTFIGMAFGFGAAICYSIFLIGSSVLPKEIPPFYQSFIMVFVNVIFLSLFFSPSMGGGSLNPFSGIWKWGILLGAMGQFFPPLLITYGAPIVGGTMTSILGSVELPVGVLFSGLFLGEPITALQWFGIVLILAGILLTQIPMKKPLPDGKVK